MPYTEFVEWIEYFRGQADKGEASSGRQSWQALQASLMQHSRLVANRGGH